MITPWAGQVAKHIMSKKRPRSFWNVFFSVGIFLILFFVSTPYFKMVSERVTYTTSQTFIEYKDGHLYTDVDSFKIPEQDQQEVEIITFLKAVDNGDEITLTISKISGELLEVEFLNKVVYKKMPTPIAPTVIFSIILVLPILAFCVFMLVVTNIKHPGKRIDKIQKQFLLRIYK